jgi:hypothetical protein
MGYGRNRETFPSRTGPNFDPIAPAENVADLTFSFLFDAARANRIAQQNAFDDQLPSLTDVMVKVRKSVFGLNVKGDYQNQISLMVQNKMVDNLITLSKDSRASSLVKAEARAILKDISSVELNLFANKGSKKGKNSAESHKMYLADKISAFMRLPEEISTPTSISVPDGAPIGSEDMSCDFDF